MVAIGTHDIKCEMKSLVPLKQFPAKAGDKTRKKEKKERANK